MKKKFHLKSSIVLLGVLGLVFFSASKPGEQDTPTAPMPIYLNTSYSFEERAADLVSRFTLEEKQSLLGNSMAAVPRLGIKAYNVWSEALHGLLAGANPSVGLAAPSSFSNSVALGSSWDPDLVQRVASAISDEARAFFATGSKGLTYWSPVVEPIRDPRWGRTGESYGEDPFLVSEIGGGFVRGMMGDDPTYLKAVPTAKHYLANNSEFDRHVSSSNMDSRDMREFYIAPYKALIERDKLPSIMSSYNAVNGVPTSASLFYLDSLARRTYGMLGYITGDCAAVDDIYSGHYYVDTPAEAAAVALIAGLDSDCGSVYQRFTIDALNQGLVSIDMVDRALRNMFTIRMRTGEFDPLSKVAYSQYQPNLVNSPGNQALAREIATRTPVLMKNDAVSGTEQKALPLNASQIKKIALIGPQANEVELGPYSGRPAAENMITPLAGISKYLSNKGYDTEVVYSSGGNASSKSNLLYIANFEIIKTNGATTRYDATKYTDASAGITVGTGMGSEEQVRTIDDGSWTAYENIDITDIDSLGIGVNIPTEGGIIEVRTGSPDGNLIGTLEATTAAGHRAGGVYGTSTMMKIKANRLGFNGAQTLFFVYNAPASPEIDEETISVARSADVAVVFVGTDENTATEEADRLTLLLPGNQVDLIKAVAAVNKHTIVVMQTLGCVEVEEFKHLQNIPGIVWVGYNGQAQGDAMAEVLFGDVNPGGKTNATWYKSVNDLPAITDYTLRGGPDKNGRTLWYFNKDVSYEFGYGLSYTTFAYSNFRIDRTAITPNDKLTIQVDVTNTGSRDGDEVVQIYMTTPDSPASAQRPIKRLKGFQRVTIPAGQTKTVSIEINCADLWFWDMDEEKITYDAGRYVFEVGASSKDIRGTVAATMSGSLNTALKVVVAENGKTVMSLGETAQTSVTASMTDDTFYDIARAKVVYTSNNPAVASVDANGLVTAKGSGVATISAHVTINGKTVSGSFPIKVMPELNAASITVGGKKIPAFDPNTLQYSYLLRSASGSAPVVAATATDPSIRMEVVQAKGVPGTAWVTLFDGNTYQEKQYAINFGTKSAEDQFNGSSLGAQWTWVREDKANWSLTEKPGSLSITSGKSDIAGTANDARNLLLQSANTDWTIETKITASRKPSGAQNAGLVAYQDDDNFVRLAYRASAGRRGAPTAQPTEQPGSVELLVESNGTAKPAITLSMADIITDNNTLYLRLVKKGDLYTAFYSVDGKKFEAVGSSSIMLKDIQAGVLVTDGVVPAMMAAFTRNMPQTPAQAPFKVAFDYVKITNSGLR
ncbi:MAG: glycoside hydrolase family 3 C-terminal domain-containing protein [Rikenellaceae bacterium]|jgi:beta-glucosidase-like glycosyl hydrolase|nr:glycoside hydrolase family 3 C-terminal domain-containing protein [Rikenellaceae bacterium]